MSQNAIPIESGFNSESQSLGNEKFFKENYRYENENSVVSFNIKKTKNKSYTNITNYK